MQPLLNEPGMRVDGLIFANEAMMGQLRKDQALDPPWPRFTQLVRRCLDLADPVVDRIDPG